MKKVFSFLAVVVFIATFTSCKKDYTCTCTIAGVEQATPLDDMKKSDAEDACATLDTAAQLAGGSCTLD